MKSKIQNFVRVHGYQKVIEKLGELDDENKEIWENFCQTFNEVFETDLYVFREISSKKIQLFSHRNNSSLIKKSFICLADLYGFSSNLKKIGYLPQTISQDRNFILGLPKIKTYDLILQKIEKFKETWQK